MATKIGRVRVQGEIQERIQQYQCRRAQ